MPIVHAIFAFAVSALLLLGTRRSPVALGVALCFAGVWCTAAIALRRRARWSWFLGSAGCVGVLLLLLSVQFIRRIAFVVHDGGMEAADGAGSPLAFLLGFAFEMMLLIPVIVFSVWLWRRRAGVLRHGPAA